MEGTNKIYLSRYRQKGTNKMKDGKGNGDDVDESIP